MRISLDVLRRSLAGLPDDMTQARHLLDDMGLEVKRVEGRCFVLELLANRGDHRCYLGLAYELAGRLGGAVCVPPSAEIGQGGPVKVSVQTDACLRYVAVPIEIIDTSKPLSEEAQAVLVAAGLRSIDAVVDATNIANAELGQPTHAFDADKIVGGITVRLSVAGESAWPLFQAGPVALAEGTLVIADDEKILAIAGVIGCESSKVTADTRRVILESACFDPVRVHKASRRLGIHTDASARFERGSDPAQVVGGAGRVLQLLVEAQVARLSAPASIVGAWSGDQHEIVVPLAALSAWYGRAFSFEEVAARLVPMGFVVSAQADAFVVTVPTWRRWDVRSREDIFEEVGRAIGYNALPSELPPVALGAILSPAEALRSQLGEILVGYGFYEVITDGFYSKTLRDNLGISESHPLWAHVETLNALDKGYTLLKNNGLAQALEGLARNQAMGVEQVRTFEFTRTFHPDPSGCREEPIVWGLLCGPERDADWSHKPAAADIWTAKGIFEEIAQALHAPLTFATSIWAPKGIFEEIAQAVYASQKLATARTHPLASVLHPHRQQQVFCCDREVGIFGEVHPRLIKTFGIRKGRPIYFELALNRICALPEAAVPLPGARPYSVRSLAFTLPHGVEGAKVLAVLRVHAHPALVKAEITDVYVHEQDGKPVRTLTFVLSYQNEDASLTAEAINAATEALIPAVHTALGGLGVRLRA